MIPAINAGGETKEKTEPGTRTASRLSLMGTVDKKDALKSKKEVFSLSCQRLLNYRHNRNFLAYISNEIGRWSE